MTTRIKPGGLDTCAAFVAPTMGKISARTPSNFGTDAEHDLYLNAINDTDQNRAALGRGYRAGLTLTAHEPDE